MTANTISQTASKSPCGCGGAKALTPGGGCGCGGGCAGNSSCGCSTCQSEFFVRPQFFAGQLLTEDDLQSLVDYLTAKNRLHNRYLFGDGVVCGLTVSCPPCGTGKVTVNPGYALDCCGNDIFVSCPVDLDINRMAHDLLIKLRGADCGDPCAEKANPRDPQQADPSKTHGRRYCLYINYCEQQSDLVAPYSTGDTCGQSSCEATRIREGYRFELRCPVEENCPPGAPGRFRDCIGDQKTATLVGADAAFVSQYSRSLESALRAAREESVPEFKPESLVGLKENSEALLKRTKAFKAGGDEEGRSLAALARATLPIAATLARVRLQPNLRLTKEQESAVMEGEKALEAARRILSPEAIEGELSGRLERAQAYALIDLSGLLTSGPERVEEIKRAVAEPTTFMTGRALSLRLLAENVVLTHSFFVETSSVLSSLREWAILRMEQPGQTNCSALCNVDAVSPPRLGGNAELGRDDALSLAQAGNMLSGAILTVQRNCLCDSLLPPCAPCDDTGVLLACLTVKDCKVTEICNIERKFVFSIPAIRYWFPGLACLGIELDKLCCPSCLERAPIRETGFIDAPANNLREMFEGEIQQAPLAVRTMLSSIMEPGPGTTEFPKSLLSGRVASRVEEENRRQALEATAELQKRLEGALEEIRSLKDKQAKLQDRVVKVEKHKAVGVHP